MKPGKFLGLRLFLEGVEVPILGIRAQAGINAPATAQIQIPAADEVHKFLPRTLVHVFYWDHDNVATEKELVETGVDISNKKRWRLLFAGEVMSYQYVKTGGMRHVALSCVDFSTYWDAMKLYWGGARVSTRSLKQAVFTGATTLTHGRKLASSTGDLLKLLRTRPAVYPKLPGLLGGLISLIESIGGVYQRRVERRFRGANDFFSQAELRLKLTRMIGVHPEDDTSAKFLNEKSFARYLRRVSRAVRSTASYRQLLEILLEKVYHQYTSVLAPPYRPPGATILVNVLVPNSKVIDQGLKAKLAVISDRIDQAYEVASARYNATRGQIGVPGTSGDDRGTAADPIRSKSSKEVDVAGHAQFDTDISETNLRGADFLPIQDEISTKKQTGLRGSAASAAVQGLEAAKAAGIIIDRMLITTGNEQEGIEDDYVNHTEDNLNLLLTSLDSARSNLKKALFRPTYRKIKQPATLQDRLITHIFRPDIWMVPPPRCNVIFPDRYDYVTFQRAWLSEVTRLWLHGRTASGRAKRKMYFAPNTDIILGPSTKDAARAARRGENFLMKHEIFSGIIPSIEGLGDEEVFSKINKTQDKAIGSSLAGPTPHMARASNYLFFKGRFQPRTMQTQGPFFPAVVPGLPALVVDPLIITDVRAEGDETKKARGTHYLGLVETIVHDINQQGASTSIVMSHCRAYNEGLDIFEGGTRVKARSRGPATRRRVPGNWRCQVISSQEDGSVTNSDIGVFGYYGRSGSMVTEALVLQGLKPKKGAKYTISVYGMTPGRVAGTVRVYTPGEVAANKELRWIGQSGGNPLASIGLTEARFTLPCTVTERTGGKIITEEKRDVPFEDIARPPWLSTIYLNSNIGPKFYQELLGVSSIVDDEVIANVAALKNLVTPQEADTGVVTLSDSEESDPEITLVYETKRTDPQGNIVTESKSVDIPANIISGSNTKDAVESIAATYVELVKTPNVDIDNFVDGYTRRDVANMEDMFGPGMNNVQELNEYASPPSDETLLARLRAALGISNEGFHLNAFGPFSNLDGLEHEPLLKASSKGKLRKINGNVDPRAARYQSIINYRDIITSSIGHRG